MELIKQAIDFAERREEYSDSYYERKAADLQTTLEGWVASCDSYDDDELRKLAKHMRKHLQEWFTFLRQKGVPATNNHAETPIATKRGGAQNQWL